MKGNNLFWIVFILIIAALLFDQIWMKLLTTEQFYKALLTMALVVLTTLVVSMVKGGGDSSVDEQKGEDKG